MKILLLSLVLSSCTSFEIKKDFIDNKLGQEITILQVSDLHINKNKSIYRKLIEEINEINPDILFLTGDSLDQKDKFHLLDNFLQGINPDIPKYAVLGNWEHWSNLNIKKLDEIYYKHGVKLLINDGSEIEINNQKLCIYGTDDFTAGRPTLKNANFESDSINIILTHSPEYFDYILKEHKNKKLLIFSGHTHGGQITLFGKPLFVPSGSGEYLKGTYIKSNSRLYVSKGIGNSKVDFRLFAKPDIFEVIVN